MAAAAAVVGGEVAVVGGEMHKDGRNVVMMAMSRMLVRQKFRSLIRNTTRQSLRAHAHARARDLYPYLLPCYLRLSLLPLSRSAAGYRRG